MVWKVVYTIYMVVYTQSYIWVYTMVYTISIFCLYHDIYHGIYLRWYIPLLEWYIPWRNLPDGLQVLLDRQIWWSKLLRLVSSISQLALDFKLVEYSEFIPSISNLSFRSSIVLSTPNFPIVILWQFELKHVKCPTYFYWCSSFSIIFNHSK